MSIDWNGVGASAARSMAFAVLGKAVISSRLPGKRD